MILEMRAVILFLLKNKLILLTLFLFLTNLCVAQKYSRGLILESEDELTVQRSPTLILSDYFNLPKYITLKNYSPEPGDQGPFSTCGAWATAYSARTISYLISNRIETIDKKDYYFSPSFVYNQLKKDTMCLSGISLREALDIIKNKGSLFYKDFDYSCDRVVSLSDLIKAKNYDILDYREIFSRNDKLKVLKTKKSVSEFKPVIIAMACPISFENVTDIWEPKPEDYKNYHNGHAVVVTGYDDEKYGGSFEVLNSWGSEWGINGYCWIKYRDFEHFVYNGYELIEKVNLTNINDVYNGSIYLKLLDSSLMEFEKVNGIICSKNAYPPKTQFEIFITNNTPCYIYCFAIDDQKNFTKIFPKDSLINNIFPYRKSTLPIPDEFHFLELDDKGTEDYIFILLSKRPVDLSDLTQKMLSDKKGISEIILKLLAKSDNQLSAFINSDNKILFSSIANFDIMSPIVFKIKKRR